MAIPAGSKVRTPRERDSEYDNINPAHYKVLGQYSAIHVVERWELGYHLGNCLKYIQRAGKKPGATGLEDLKKARWYLQRFLYLLDPENEEDPAA